MSLPPGVRIEDPCAYCGRLLVQVAELGCGSQEMRDAERCCHVVDWARRRWRWQTG
jgi:hypothetical protein